MISRTANRETPNDSKKQKKKQILDDVKSIRPPPPTPALKRKKKQTKLKEKRYIDRGLDIYERDAFISYENNEVQERVEPSAVLPVMI